MTLKTKFLSLFLIIVFSTSCGPEKAIYQNKEVFSKLGWNYHNIPTFDVSIGDIEPAYEFILKFEFDESFPNNYIKFQLEKSNAAGESYVKVFSIPVKNINGSFIDENIDGVYTVTAILTSQMYFSSPGDYQVSIEQIMPKFDTKGVKSIEFIITKSSK